MPKGLAFLSKKSWHTGKLANQEKVWVQEQEKKAEEVKIKELAKQIQQEREEEELNRLSGRNSTRLDRGIDWMYQGGPRSDGKLTAYEEEQKKKEQEEYLLGKEYNPNNVAKGDLAAEDSNVGVNMVLTRTSEIVDDSRVEKERTERDDIQDWNSNFHLRHEDPMFMVEQQRKEKQTQVEKKERLFKSVRSDDEASSSEDDRRNRRHERKRKHKSDRRRSRKERDNDHSYESRRERKHRKKDKKRKRHRREYSRSRSRSPYSRDRDYRHDEEDDYERRSRRRSRSRSRRRDREDYRKERKTDKTTANMESKRIPEEDKKYGLVGKSKPLSSFDLGPDRELLHKKRKEKDDARKRYSGERDGPRSDHRSRPMSEREKEEALRAMKADASDHSRNMSHRDRKSNAELYEEEIQRRKGNNAGHARFLSNSTREIHDYNVDSRMAAVRSKNHHHRDDRF